jgi:UDP-4-amino-4,6-dideoxy-N-acetyl-beta-L-altrosamine N-acetyltransferase
VKIGLREVGPEDSERLLRWRNLPEVAQWMKSTHEISPSEHDRWFRGVLARERRVHWVILVDGTPVGTVNISAIDPASGRCEWGLYLGDETARGTGAALGASLLSLDIAFAAHRISVVECEVKPDNTRAIALYERLGFECVGSRESLGTSLVLYEMSAARWPSARTAALERLRSRGAEI